MRKFILLVVAGLLARAIWSYEARPSSDAPVIAATIDELNREPSRFEGRQVVVPGVVGNRLTLAGYGGYELVNPADGASIFIGASRTPPRTGASASVTGRFVTLVAAGAYSVTLIQEAVR